MFRGFNAPTHILRPAAIKLNWMLGAEPLEDHLVGGARGVVAIVFAPRHPCEQRQSENALRERGSWRRQIVERESDEMRAGGEALQKQWKRELLPSGQRGPFGVVVATHGGDAAREGWRDLRQHG